LSGEGNTPTKLQLNKEGIPMLKYFFHIVDREFNDEYDYEGYFSDHLEADDFIRENEEAGNTVTILAPYFVEVDEAEANF
jgi:hypothetical protein